ncbi:MAG: hypothetical protein H7315_17810 [Herminiimonas sp.]|nr:hypothetical protein [Herminiimonas sp.]
MLATNGGFRHFQARSGLSGHDHIADIGSKCEKRAVDGMDFLRRLRFASFLAVAPLILVLILRSFSYEPEPVSQSLADGVYYNPQCGHVTLKNGLMSFEGGKIRYRLVVEKTDLQGFTKSDLAVTNDHKIIVLAGKAYSSIWFWHAPYRFNDINQYDARHQPPDRLTFSGAGNKQYDFSRVAGPSLAKPSSP